MFDGGGDGGAEGIREALSGAMDGEADLAFGDGELGGDIGWVTETAWAEEPVFDGGEEGAAAAGGVAGFERCEGLVESGAGPVFVVGGGGFVGGWGGEGIGVEVEGVGEAVGGAALGVGFAPVVLEVAGGGVFDEGAETGDAWVGAVEAAGAEEGGEEVLSDVRGVGWRAAEGDEVAVDGIPVGAAEGVEGGGAEGEIAAALNAADESPCGGWEERLGGWRLHGSGEGNVRVPEAGAWWDRSAGGSEGKEIFWWVKQAGEDRE